MVLLALVTAPAAAGGGTTINGTDDLTVESPAPGPDPVAPDPEAPESGPSGPDVPEPDAALEPDTDGSDGATDGDGPEVVEPSAPHVADRVIVTYAPGTTARARGLARSSVAWRTTSPISPRVRTTELVTLVPGTTVGEAIAELTDEPGVLHAEPDYLLRTADVPSDPDLGLLWGMLGPTSTPASSAGSRAVDAWNVGRTGSSDVHVVVIDEGIQWSHPDLAANVSRVHGYDFIRNRSEFYSSADGDAHGTHVAGTIGAIGDNGIGVAGVVWDVTLVSAKFLGPRGGTISNAIRAIDHATDLKTRLGLDVVATNNSWGGGGRVQALEDAINRGGDAGILFVVAAGNDGRDIDAGSPAYPASYRCDRIATGPDAGAPRGWDCIISVASIASSGALSSFSNRGPVSVDIAAPGSGIRSTVPTNSYRQMSGTSMAAPHVTGALAMCAAIDPDLTAQELRARIIDSAVLDPNLTAAVELGRRLDIAAVAAACDPEPAPPVIRGMRVDAVVGEDVTVDVVMTLADLRTGLPLDGGEAVGELRAEPMAGQAAPLAPRSATLSVGAAGVASGSFDLPSDVAGSRIEFCVTELDGVPLAVERCAGRLVAPPLAIDVALLSNASTHLPYEATLAASGGDPGAAGDGLRWERISGALPAGLTLTPTGTLSGTPTRAGSSTFTVRVSDAGSPALTSQRSFTLVVDPVSVVRVASVSDRTKVNRRGAVSSKTTVAVVDPATGTGARGAVVTAVWTIPGTDWSRSVTSKPANKRGVATLAPGKVSLAPGERLELCLTDVRLAGRTAAPLPACRVIARR
jgi:subtilisin family serine protease